MLAGLAVQQHLAQSAAILDALGGGLGLDGADHRTGTLVVGEEALHRAGEGLGHLVEAEVLVTIADAAARHVDGLGGGAHLAGIEAQGEGQVAGNGLDVTHAVDDHAVDAGLLGEHLGLAGVVFQPVAEGAGTGEIHQLDPRVQGQALAHRRFRGVHHQADQRRVEAQFSQHLLGHLDAHGHRQDGAGVRLDQHRVAGRQAGEQAGIGVPGGEGRTGDHQRQAARNDVPALVQHQRVLLALGLDPARRFRHLGHGAPGVGQHFQATVLRMGAAGLEGHHVGLAAGVHHGMGQCRAEGIQALEDFQAGPHPRLRSGIPPGRQRRLLARKQRVGVVLVVAHIQVETVGRTLGAGTADRFRPDQREVLAEQRLEGSLGTFDGVLRVLLEAFREGRPVAALADGLDGALEGAAMVLEQFEGGGAGGGRHGRTPQQGR
ncbi:hypothetical protein D9M72_423760 [compost metagenome]